MNRVFVLPTCFRHSLDGKTPCYLLRQLAAGGDRSLPDPPLSTPRPAFGLDGPSAGRTVYNVTSQGSAYRRGNSVKSNGASSLFPAVRLFRFY